MFTRYGSSRTLALLTLLIFTSAVFAGGKNGKNETAVTIWLVFFNDPSACVEDQPPHDPGDCTEYDIFYNPDAMADVCYLAGQSVQANGRMSISGRFAEGSDHGCPFGIGNGLIDADAAEIHSVLQEHGWALESGDGLEDQIGEFLGNCNPDGATGPEPENYGSCVDSQVTIHQPSGADVTVRDVYRFADFSMVEGANTMLTREADGIRFSWHTRLAEDD